MKHLSRYVLVGLLIGGMAVDPAVAGRMFRRSCCRCECLPACCKASPVPVCSDPSPEIVEENCNVCAENTVAEVIDSACQGCESSTATVSEPESEELAVPPSTPSEVEAKEENVVEDVMEDVSEYVEEAVEENNEVLSEEAPKNTQSVLVGNPRIGPPAPLAEPEVSPSSIVVPPPVVETPAEPVAESEEEKSESDYQDLFDEPAPAESVPPMNVPPKLDSEPTEEEKPEVEDKFEDIFSTETQMENKGVTATVQPFQPQKSVEEPVVESNDGFSDALSGVEEELAVSEESEEEDATPQSPEGSIPTESEEEFDIFDPEARESVLESEGGLQSELARVWTDRTGTFECKARLVDVSTTSVVLKRPSGRKLSVKLSKLGNNDLEFVRQQVVALRIVRARDAAAEKMAVAWAR